MLDTVFVSVYRSPYSIFPKYSGKSNKETEVNVIRISPSIYLIILKRILLATSFQPFLSTIALPSYSFLFSGDISDFLDDGSSWSTS